MKKITYPLHIILRAALVDIFNIVLYGWRAPRYAELIWVKPEEVLLQYIGDSLKTGGVIDGDWDRRVIALREKPKAKKIIRKLSSGCSWRETGIYDRILTRIAEGKSMEGCADLADIEKRYRKLDILIDTLRNNGKFKTRAEMGGFREFGGIQINIDRSGNPIFGQGGCHRLIIAQELKIPMIPAMLNTVHESAIKSGSWLKYRSCTNGSAKRKSLTAQNCR